jgi:thiamine pyrophosphokinase
MDVSPRPANLIRVMPAEESHKVPELPSSALEEGFSLRAIVFANGILSDPASARALIQPGDLLIAADGGSRHLQQIGLIPAVLIGDFDSLEEAELDRYRAAGVEIIQHPAQKDFTDLELALQYAQRRGAGEIWVLAALGARWDQTLANLLLPASRELASCRIALIDGPQEIRLVRSGDILEVRPPRGYSHLSCWGDALGVTTQNLEYPLRGETLVFGETRGVSNVLLGERASVQLERGLLLCVVIHHSDRE